MKVWVDGQCFQTGSNVRGIGRYVIDFLNTLAQRNVELVVSLNGSMKQETVAARSYLKKNIPNCDVQVWYGTSIHGELVTAYCQERMLDEHILTEHINQINPDVALSPSPFEGTGDIANPFIKVGELNSNIISSCIYHDAIPHRFPDIYLQDENAYKLYYRRFDEIANFDVVLCNSQFTENEYQEIYEQKNSVAISAGLSGDIQYLINNWIYDQSSFAQQFGDYVVYVGGMDWRKNVPCLVKGMANLAACRAGDLKLVLVGDFGDEYITPLRTIFDEYDIPQTCLVTTGYISDKELVDLYKNAVAAVQPSRMEGFGLGALEAMACGTPFFSAAGGAVEEVVQSEAQLFDPDVHHTLTQLLQKLLSDSDFKETIIDHGYQRASMFSWDKTVDLSLDAFTQALDKRPVSLTLESSTEALVESTPSSRLIMDVTSTAQSPVLSGIQRVMHNLSKAALKQNATEHNQTVLSYCKDRSGWYALSELSKPAVKLTPQNRIEFKNNDSYLLLDSSWTFIEGQEPRLADALVCGEEVVHGIHDIGPLTMSAMTDEGMPPAFRRWFEFVLGYSTGIVCVSRAVADEVYQLIEDIKLPRPMKVGYFRLGADFADVEPEISELNFTKTRPTFLMVGTIEPRKGQYYGLKAFEKLWEQGVDVNLVIVGKAGWDTKLLQAMLENHPEREKRLFWRQGISDAGLAAAYQVADALIMTSYLEGFGLPVVEAGRKNCPVILADLPVFREVGEGAPKASYFEAGSAEGLAQAICTYIDEELDKDHQAVEVSWPSWDESAQEIKEVVLNGNWHKYYEPEQVLPNTRFDDVGEIYTLKALNENEIAHSLNIAEGPFLSDDGSHLRIAVAVKNLSDNLWSSNIGLPGGKSVNLSYHLYDKAGNILNYDNPRTHIPFVLPANNEIIMPIRVDTDWLLKGAHSVGIELVQEGVRWFGNELKLLLTQPYVADGHLELAPAEVKLSAPQLVYFRGPFGPALDTEQYFLFSVINSEKFALPYYDQDKAPLFTYALVDKEGNKSNKGVWAVSHFDCVEAYNSGYIGLFTNAKHIEASEFIEVTYQDHAWRFDLATNTIEQLQVQPKVQVNDFDWMETLTVDNQATQELSASFTSDSPITLRGFNELEESHVWMSEMTGEIDISNLINEKTLITKVRVICSPFKQIQGPVELNLFFGKQLIENKIISSDFMEYIFEINKDQMRALIKNQYRIKFVTNGNAQELGGERMLSICFANLSFTTLHANK
ncbi:glycosyltransferase family 1 protein [uncultured Psychromonas sp.]|uniref:glycosyltransferase family 4 protein n=1 Tax=uncultured Psychromonas sp. TaxID=173974 RepID=UPI00260371C8|nr:glycosyltransferase family 1 protein [uncultured Psychromonas sp.]